MSVRQILQVSILALLAASAGIAAVRYDLTSLAMGVLAAIVVGGWMVFRIKSEDLMVELAILRDHLETTRQQAALLARHTRELRDSVVQTGQVYAQDQVNGNVRSHDFAALSALVRDIADGVSELDRRGESTERELADLRRQRASEPRNTPAAGWVSPPRPALDARLPVRDAVAETMRATLKAMPEPASFSSVNEPPRHIRQLVAAAIAADRFDLFLQRVVGLPQRKIRGYEVTLRPEGADVTIANSLIRGAIDIIGHQLAFDRKLMVQTIRLARMFERRDRDVLLFADISQRYLLSEAAFDELTALVGDAPAAPQRIILCLPQRFFTKAVAYEHEALRKLTELGFRFLVRDVEDVALDVQRLERMGVRWVRLSAQEFLDAAQSGSAMMGVAPGDYVALLGRRKLMVIAEEISDEPTVAELLDLNIEFAQGLAFAPPQAVRADAFETNEPPARPTREAGRDTMAPVLERRGLRDLARRA